MTTAPKKVLVFDSGLGGITIFQAIRKRYPSCELIYCTDNEAFPYGNKPEAELIERVSKVLTTLDLEYKPDIFVIACNSASTVALPKVRSLIKSPVVGVVPAIKPASAIAKTPCIGLLATPGTINRSYTQSLIDQFAATFHWIRVGSSELVEIAEKKMYGEPVSIERMQKIIKPFAQYPPSELDSIVLACTHFPLLKEELKQILPNITHWIDSSDAIANRVGFWLHELGVHEGDHQHIHESHQIVFTQKVNDESKIESLLKTLDIKKIHAVSIQDPGRVSPKKY